MRKTLIPVVLAVAACLNAFGLPALAGDPAPFTAAELKKFISDYPAFAAHMEAEGQVIEDAQKPETWEGIQRTSRMMDYLKKKGWEPERFFYVVSHVGAGLVAVTLEEEAPAVEARFSEAEAEIMGNEYLSDEMKQQLLSHMRQGAEQVKQLDQAGKDLPASERQLIRKNKDRIQKAFEAP